MENIDISKAPELSNMRAEAVKRYCSNAGSVQKQYTIKEKKEMWDKIQTREECYQYYRQTQPEWPITLCMAMELVMTQKADPAKKYSCLPLEALGEDEAVVKQLKLEAMV